MFENVLVEQNSQWEGKFYPFGAHRECFEKIKACLSLPHVISVTGVRRAGKSTLLKQLINHLIQNENVPPLNILFVNLEHPYFAQYSGDVANLEKIFEEYLKIALPSGKIYCFLDEVQFFSNWPIFVKSHYEQRNVKFVITGSNSFLMSHELLTLLSGRTIPVEVFPFSYSEWIKVKMEIDLSHPIVVRKYRHELKHHLDHYLRYGGFPEILFNVAENMAYEILNSYSKTILYQDVVARLHLKKPIDLERLFYYLSTHIGICFSYSGLAKLFGLSDKTIREYIRAFEDSNLLFEISKFSYSLKQQVRSNKKVYSIDTGIINAIAFKFSENLGHLFENVVFLVLKRKEFETYYYHTRSGYEIDFIIKKDRKVQLIQVSVDMTNEKTRQREIRAIIQAAQELRLSKGTIVTADEEEHLNIENIEIEIVPLYKFLISLN